MHTTEKTSFQAHLLDQISDGVLVFGAGSGLVYTNASVEWVCGVPGARLIGWTLEALLTFLGVPPVRRSHIERALQNGGSWSGDLQLTLPGGETKYVYSTLSPFHEEGTLAPSTMCVLRDITDRWLSEQTLRVSEERYRSFVETISEAIWCYELPDALPINRDEDEQVAHIYRHAYIAECNGVFAQEIGGGEENRIVGKKMADVFDLTPERARFLGDFVRAGYRLESRPYSDYNARGERRHFLVNVVGMIENRRLMRIWGSRIDVTDKVEMEHRVVAALEEQQQRIGQDLHDGVGQFLTAVRMLSDQLAERLTDQASAESALALKIARYAQDALDHTRKIYRGLTPVELRVDGLHAALSQLSTHVNGFSRASCKVQAEVNRGRLTGEEELHLYRIAQEAVHNAVKHGNAKHITISLLDTGRGIALQVQDDGIGFDPRKAANQSLGLEGMRYRAGVLRADLQIESAPGAGTRVWCEVPGD